MLLCAKNCRSACSSASTSRQVTSRRYPIDQGRGNLTAARALASKGKEDASTGVPPRQADHPSQIRHMQASVQDSVVHRQIRHIQ